MSLAEDGRPLTLTWHYTPREIVADGVIHGLGVVFGLAGAAALVATALTAHLGFGERAAVVLYATALVLMLGVSAVYNLYPVSPRKWLLRRADHALIYLMIAGTYTPLVALVGSGIRAYLLLAVIWLVALVGIAVKLFLPGRFDRLSIALYLLLGWSGLLAYESVIAALQPTALWLLAIGGLLYSVGVLFHVWRTLPFQNAIWHGFVLAATACHYGTIWASLNGLPLT
ncbi:MULTISPECIES: hemolysin III family protein [Methylobacterium]|uniref:PAQR family membrane homeostasis protein TrhA n=1 Tax=Methylobacterium TaxID=407 RepID=UPI0011C1E089|nr:MULTISPECIES: hemolysin III family protein [Methylobacterium]QEE42794.1 hemolysin III family protein [Methylobacterium sp. WL1]TXN02699.1 hemolysin III family protein [Methylobacterium sp. WL64]TXN43955.1 hemolysin III family protein [Methylobacterium sp. WL7]TXN56632.1 hemolysin III family protein [Methylobacterium sp. WL2]TXN57711.1 hemolysin III family protein [Methylobacterium sp. WL18]